MMADDNPFNIKAYSIEALTKEMADGGYRYSAGQESNIFGEKYLEKYNEKFKK